MSLLPLCIGRSGSGSPFVSISSVLAARRRRPRSRGRPWPPTPRRPTHSSTKASSATHSPIRSALRSPHSDPADMDPATQTHPILSYVLSRIPTLSKPNKAPTSEFDIEQPPVHTPSPRTTPSSPSAGEFELVERMPGLRHPSVLRSMTCVVADVSAARGALQVRAPRPNHELVDSSRVIVAAAEACRAVVRLEETHDAYEALLHEAEVRLERVYRSAMEGTDLDDDEAAAESGKGEGPAAAEPKGGAGDAAVQEEVVGTRPGPGAPQHLWQSFPTAPMRAISRSTSGAQPPTATGPRTAHASAVADTHSSASSALAGSVTMRWIEHADVHHALPGDARPMLEQSVTSPKRAPFVSASPLNSSSPSEATDGNHAAAAAHLAVLKIAREPPRGHGTEAGGYGGGRPIPGEPARRTASARGRRWRRARWLSLMVQGQP